MSQFLTVKQTAEKFPAFTESSIRYHLFHRKTNGLTKHIRKIGRKVLIDEVGFQSWINASGKTS